MFLEKGREEEEEEEEEEEGEEQKGMNIYIFAWVLVLYALLRVCMDFWLVPNLGLC